MPLANRLVGDIQELYHLLPGFLLFKEGQVLLGAAAVVEGIDHETQGPLLGLDSFVAQTQVPDLL